MKLSIEMLRYMVSKTTIQIWCCVDCSVCSAKYVKRLRWIEPIEAGDFSRN